MFKFLTLPFAFQFLLQLLNFLLEKKKFERDLIVEL
jgi:hypothetical protein